MIQTQLSKTEIKRRIKTLEINRQPSTDKPSEGNQYYSKLIGEDSFNLIAKKESNSHFSLIEGTMNSGTDETGISLQYKLTKTTFRFTLIMSLAIVAFAGIFIYGNIYGEMKMGTIDKIIALLNVCFFFFYIWQIEKARQEIESFLIGLFE